MGMYIIAEPCIGTKDTACVDVCPVDCIHPRKDEAGFEAAEMLYIDPDVCIQCGNCEPACPVTAIFTEETIPEKWKHFQQVNADWYKNQQAGGGKQEAGSRRPDSLPAAAAAYRLLPTGPSAPSQETRPSAHRRPSRPPGGRPSGPSTTRSRGRRRGRS